MTDWREDEGWRLQWWATDYWTSAPPDKPGEKAELSTDPAWSFLYEGRRIVAHWWRPVAIRSNH